MSAVPTAPAIRRGCSAPPTDPAADLPGSLHSVKKSIEADIQFVTASARQSHAIYFNGAMNNLFVNRKQFPYLVGGKRWVPRY